MADDPLFDDLPIRWPGDGLDAMRYSAHTARALGGETPWADPGHDVMADLREAMKLAERMPPRRTLHCARDVVEALAKHAKPAGYWTSGLDLLTGIDIFIDSDMQPGQWELREGDTVVDSGQLGHGG